MLSKICCAFAMTVICYAQQPGPYTAAQATAGRAIYQANCAGCHAADLTGLNSASALAGGLFMSSWGDRTPSDLIAFLEGAMPPGNPGSLGEQAYVNVTAFILDFNGARAGNQPLTAASKVAIRSVATGQAKAQPAGATAPGEPLGGRAEAPVPPTPRGLIVAGEVKNYTPVTDAMLRNPDPSDWLMIRHDYHANNYSTLNQITTQNVKDLQLQWVWAMNEGTNQAGAGGAQRRDVHQQSRQHRAGAGARRGRSDLGEPHRPTPPAARSAASRSTTTRFTSPPATRTSTRWTRAPARMSGTR